MAPLIPEAGPSGVSGAPCRVFLTGSDAQVALTKRLLQQIANEQLGGAGCGTGGWLEPWVLGAVLPVVLRLLGEHQRCEATRDAQGKIDQDDNL